MALKKIIKPIISEKKDEIKIEPKIEPKIELKTAIPSTPIVSSNSSKGVGIVGRNDSINRFRATCRYRNIDIGVELMKLIKEWNIKNKIEN